MIEKVTDLVIDWLIRLPVMLIAFAAPASKPIMDTAKHHRALPQRAAMVHVHVHHGHRRHVTTHQQ